MVSKMAGITFVGKLYADYQKYCKAEQEFNKNKLDFMSLVTPWRTAITPKTGKKKRKNFVKDLPRRVLPRRSIPSTSNNIYLLYSADAPTIGTPLSAIHY